MKLDENWAFASLLLVFLAVCLTVGGATQENVLNNVVVRLAALPVLGWAALRLRQRPACGTYREGLLLLLLFALLPVLQLVPLPPQVWAALPGHHALADELASLGFAAPWRPFSLEPQSTLDSALGFLPPLAMFLAVPTLSEQGRKRLIGCVLAVAVASVILGSIQLAGGTQSPLRFYPTTNTNSAVGFFSNRNHFASLLVTGVVFAALLATEWTRTDALFQRFLLLASSAALLAGVGISGSRAGLLLLVLSLTGSLAIAWRYMGRPARLNRRRSLIILAILAVPVLIAVGGGWLAAPRLGSDLAQDQRIEIWRNTAKLAAHFFPLGAGGGSFQTVYATAETADTLTFDFINHAHNDYLEVWLEYGAAGVAIMAVALAIALWSVMRLRTLTSDRKLASGFFLLAAGLMAAHSAVDYPLRTAAIGVVFAFCVAAALAPQAPNRSKGSHRSRWKPGALHEPSEPKIKSRIRRGLPAPASSPQTNSSTTNLV